jgi:SnoaL-like domain
MTAELATRRFVDALSRRDFDALEDALAPDVTVRLLLPSRVEEIDSAAAARKRIEGWFGAAKQFEVLDCGDEPIGERRRMSWRFSLVRTGDHEVIEQVAFADSDEHHVTRIDLVCSGFQPAADAPVSCAVAGGDA